MNKNGKFSIFVQKVENPCKFSKNLNILSKKKLCEKKWKTKHLVKQNSQYYGHNLDL